MIKQDWMIIVAGEPLVDEMTVEQKRRCTYTGSGYASDQVVAMQQDQARRGIRGCEIVASVYGHSVRSDSGLQNFALLASCKNGPLDGSLEDAERWAKAWVAEDPTRRYAWRRKS